MELNVAVVGAIVTVVLSVGASYTASQIDIAVNRSQIEGFDHRFDRLERKLDDLGDLIRENEKQQ